MKPSAMFYNKEIKNREKFGEWLKSTRKDHGLTVRELAEMLGVSAAYITDIEKGNRSAPLNHLEQITKIFNIPESELMYLTDIAGSSRGSWQDLNDYLGDHKDARTAVRAARDANLSDEEFLEVFLQVLDDAQRKDLIDEILSKLSDKEKVECLSWLSTILTEEQIDSYINLTNQQEKE